MTEGEKRERGEMEEEREKEGSYACHVGVEQRKMREREKQTNNK